MANVTNFEAARDFVEFGLAEKAAARRESASGPGSALSAARDCLDFLHDVVGQYNVITILDLGCGDWNWMRHLGLPHVAGQYVQYMGWEAHEPLVESLQRQYGSDEVRFQLRDIATDAYPSVDLAIARDVLFHMTPELGEKIVTRISASAKFLLTTSFPDVKTNTQPLSYLPIENWGYYEINLNVFPFNLGDRLIEKREEKQCAGSTGLTRYVCLYDLR